MKKISVTEIDFLKYIYNKFVRLSYREYISGLTCHERKQTCVPMRAASEASGNVICGQAGCSLPLSYT